MPHKRLYRSRDEKMIAGVCGGVAEYLDADPTIIRLLWAGSVIFAGMGLFLYILAAVIAPEKPVASSVDAEVSETTTS